MYVAMGTSMYSITDENVGDMASFRHNGSRQPQTLGAIQDRGSLSSK